MIKILKLFKAHNLKRIVFLFNLSVIVFISYSPKIYSQGVNPVDLETAKAVAMNYCLKTDNKYADVHENEISLSLAETRTTGKSVLYYVFNINKEDGFIIISADINTPPVLCYVPQGTYIIYPEKRPPAFNDWLEVFANQIDYSVKNPVKSLKNQNLWNALTSKGSLDLEQMALTLTSKWDQDSTYNGYSPANGNGTDHPDSGPRFDSRTPTGCVATAMGQIMYYYQWPLIGEGSHSYFDPVNDIYNENSQCSADDPSYGEQSFMDQDYNWSLMEDQPDTTNDEISRLLYNCAVSVDMDFAYCVSWTNTYKAEYAFKTYFNYDPSAKYILRSDSLDKWDSIIIDQIRKERPVQYRGQSLSGSMGHSWICYGYKIVTGSTQFLFNFGWGGLADGYFTLDQLNNVGGYDFASNNGAIINIFPLSQPDLTIFTASLETTLQTLVPFSIDFNVENNGSWDAVASTAKCYLSVNDTLDKNDIYLGSLSVPAITAGGNSDISGNLVIGDGSAGDYYILIEADTYHQVHESDETDNVKAILIDLIQSPANYGDYRSVASGSWSSLSTWQYYNGSDWVPAMIYPTASDGTITVRSSHEVTVSDDISVDQVIIATGSQVNVSSGYSLTIDDDGTDDIDFKVYGTVVNSGTITPIGKLAFNSGSTYQHAEDGGTIPVATWDVASNCNITGITETAPNIPSSTQPFGNFTWNCASQGESYIDLTGQLTSISGDFNIESTNNNYLMLGFDNTNTSDLTVDGNFYQTAGYFGIAGIDVARKMTVEGDFFFLGDDFFISTNLANGTLDIGGNFTNTGSFYFIWTVTPSPLATLNVAKNFSHISGTITASSEGSGNIVFDGTGTQTYTSGGTLENTINFTVNSGSYLQMGTAADPAVISGSDGSFTLSSGSTLGITSSAGITSSDANGNIQVTGTRAYNAGANYIYNGSGAQVSGSGLPETVNSLSVEGTSNLSLTTASPLTVTNNLTIGTGANLNIGADQQVTTEDFTNTGTMIIESTDLNSNGSFIATGTLTQSGGLVTYNRQMRVKANSGDLHFFSSPVGDLDVSGFKSANSNVSQIWAWQETDATWPVINSGNFVNGKGYNLAQTTESNGLITFTGLVVNSASITATSPYKEGYTDRSTPEAYGVGNEGADIWAPDRSWTDYGAGGWNLLGNPFTSAMDAAAFISTNTLSFDPSYQALYIFDGTTGQYQYAAAEIPGPIYQETGFFSDNVQAGQGFFVLALYDGIGFDFASDMQVHNTTVSMTKSGGETENPWPGLQLKVQYGDNEGFTTIVYNEKMTAGLDPGYDVGQYSAGSEVEIYTSLVSGSNGVNFTRQALPERGCEKNIVPVGIDSEKGGEVTFSAYTVPVGNSKFYLEDRKTGTFTDLSTDTYTVTLPEKTCGNGRFFLHVSGKRLPDTHKKTENPGQLDVQVWISFNQVIIEGAVSSKATAEMYNIQGRKIFGTRLSEGTYNTFPMPGADKGVYIVKVIDGAKVFMRKVVVL